VSSGYAYFMLLNPDNTPFEDGNGLPYFSSEMESLESEDIPSFEGCVIVGVLIWHEFFNSFHR